MTRATSCASASINSFFSRRRSTPPFTKPSSWPARGTRSLVNAVLRNALRRKEELLENASEQDLSVRSSHPQFLIDRWTQNFGAENTAALCEWNNRPAPIYARINRLKISDEEFL